MRFNRLKAGFSAVLSSTVRSVSRFATASLLVAGLAGCGDDVLGRLNSVPEISKELSFGLVPVGKQSVAELPIQNKGAAPFTIFEINKEGKEEFSTLAELPVQVAAGSLSQLSFGFLPKESGSYNGSVIIRTDSAINPDVEVKLTGDAARPLVQAIPGSLDFGRVDLNAIKSLLVNLVNTGSVSADLVVTDISGEDAALFTLSDFTTTLTAGTSRSVEISYLAARIGPAHASLSVDVPYSIHTPLSIPLIGESSPRGINGCLLAVPDQIEIAKSINCPPTIFPLTILNTCNTSIKITNAALEPMSSDFRLTSVPLPYQLHPLQAVPFIIIYNSMDLGPDSSSLHITSDSQNPLLIPLRGNTVDNVTRTDTFTQAYSGKIDILFIMDNSGSMREEQMVVSSASAAFLNAINAENIDYHIGVTTTGIEEASGSCPGGANGGEAGRLFPVDGSRARWITKNTLHAASIFASNIQVGLCHGTERGLEAAYRALSSPLVGSIDDYRTTISQDGNLGFYRTDARLVIVVVSDEEDQSLQNSSFYSTFFTQLKIDPNMVKVNVVLDTAACSSGSTHNTKYEDVAAATGGRTENICTTDWGTTLSQFAISNTTLKTRFTLTTVPENGEIIVKVNGVQVDPASYRYDSNVNEIVFNQAPVPGAVIEVIYTVGCE